MFRGNTLIIMAFVILVFFTVFFLLKGYTADIGNTNPFFNKSFTKKSGFVVDTKGCRIPDMDPMDQTVKKFIYIPEAIKCNASSPSITYIDGEFLRINKSVLKYHYKENLDYCEYQSIIRPDTNSDNIYKYSHNVTVVTADKHMTEEFIRIACYGKSGSMLSSNFHAFILEKKNVEKRCKKKVRELKQKQGQRKTNKENLNILIIGVDSISRLNFARHLPSTRKYLLEELGAFELLGYNKVADNTYVNLAPMFAGKFVEELPWDESVSYKPFDEFNFIWKNFSDHGYRTLYAEDAPNIAIFNYAKEGFHKPPTDYYLRPWSLALEEHGSIWSHGRDCVGQKLETELVLDYIGRFLDKYKSKRHLAFSFLTRLTHDNINRARLADNPYLEFFKTVNEKGTIDNTFILFYSDHGMRFGGIRETYIGKLEERLPFVYLIFPKWFLNKYPQHVDHLKANCKKLTTPFDIYETLVDILKFDGNLRENTISNRGMTLFSEIPSERTCGDAMILPHWCTCHQQSAISINDVRTIEAADSVVKFLNKATEDAKGLCAHLSLERVIDARLIEANENVLHFRNSFNDVLGRRVEYGNRTKSIQTYSITMVTKPGNAVFEATVGKIDDKYTIYGDVSRINAYNDNVSCIKKHSLRKYCICL